MRIIALMPVRNEGWIIQRTLRSLATFCDAIIVADQRSTDDTRAILQGFAPQVQIIENPEPFHSTKVRWRLLEAAREFQGHNFILLADADEIFTANITDQQILNELTDIVPGTAVAVPWIQLWRSASWWRNDASIWSNKWQTAGFRDDRLVNYGPLIHPNDHNGRIPLCREIIRFEKVKLLHYQFVLFERMRAKQCWYRVSEVMEYGRSRNQEINTYYQVTRDERRVHLEPVPEDWTAGWRAQGIDLENFEEASLYWYDVEVLRYFRDRGAAYFAPLDIWDRDWEAKRRLAREQGYDGIPAEPIRDPRSWEQRLYHAYLHRFFRTPPWRDFRELLKIPERGARALVRSLGLRRGHLEQIGFLQPRAGEPAGRHHQG